MPAYAKTDVGALLDCEVGGYTQNSGNPIAITAAGTGDNTAVTGEKIDRQDYQSCVLVIAGAADLQASETLTLKSIEYQESDDGSSWDTAVSIDSSEVVATGGTGGSDETFLFQSKLNLRGKKRYIRFNFTPDLSASATDTAVAVAVVALGGKDVLPAV